jgi:hypothetical protein
MLPSKPNNVVSTLIQIELMSFSQRCITDVEKSLKTQIKTVQMGQGNNKKAKKSGIDAYNFE